MHKKLFPKIIALVALLGFIFLSAPGVSSAEKKATKFDFGLLIKKPAAWISAAWSMFTPIFDRDATPTSKTTTPSTPKLKIKPLGDAIVGRPSGGD
jgi:hypothetical protein